MLEIRAACIAAALLALLGGTTSMACAQEPASDAEYRKLVDDAVREFSAEHWEEARALFKRAHELSPNARTLRGMGMTAYELRMYVQSLRELEGALRDPNKPLAGEMRTQVEQLITKAREFVGRVTLESEPPEAKLLIDGREPLREADGAVLLDVGTHVISASFDGYKPTNLRISVEGGGQQSVRVPLEPLLAIAAVPAIDPMHPPPATVKPAEPPPPAAVPVKPAPAPRESSSLGTVAWVALGAGAAFGITSGVLWLVGSGKYDKLEESCGNACSDDEIADSGIKGLDLMTSVSLGLAIAGGATSALLFAIQVGSADEAPTVEAGLSGVSLRGKF